MMKNLYFEIFPEKVILSSWDLKKTIEETAMVRFTEGKNNYKFHSIGQSTNSSEDKRIVEVWPFKHERSIINNPFAATELIRALAKKLYPSRWTILLLGKILVHPKIHLDGGLTLTEIQSLFDIAERAGAYQALVCDKSDFSILNFKESDLNKFEFSNYAQKWAKR